MGQVVINYGYRHYLTTAAWRAKRLQRLEIDDHRCVRCKSADELQVHHIDYGSVGDEHMDDLETLCRGCHMREHGKDPTLPSWVSDRLCADRFWEREALLAEQEEIALAAGVDLTKWLNPEYQPHVHR